MQPMDKSLYTAAHARLCDLLRQVRLGAGLQQRELAERLGKPQSFVSRYESGQRRLDLLELRKVCQAVGVSLLEFVERWERSVQ
jgi:transcriptional regulator with XRE-family HTH domain